jgi:hypothetical protein
MVLQIDTNFLVQYLWGNLVVGGEKKVSNCL